MKYASCITNPSIINQPLDIILEEFMNAGFDGIDIPGDKEIFPIKKIKPILETFENKLPIAELTAAINPNRDLVHSDAKQREIAIDYIKYCIDCASVLGNNLTHLCFITYPQNLNETPNKTLENRAITAIKELAQYADDKSVKLMIEPLFKQDNSIVNTCKQAVELWAKALNTDPETFIQSGQQFGLLQDIFHMHHEEKDYLQSIEKYNSITFHRHIADHPRGLNFSRKDSSFVKKAIEKLSELNYESYISFESFDPNFGLSTLKESLKKLRSFEKI